MKKLIIILVVWFSLLIMLTYPVMGTSFRTNTRVLLRNNGFNFQDLVAYEQGIQPEFKKDRLKLEAFLEQEVMLAEPVGTSLGLFYTREALINADGETVNYYFDGLFDDYRQSQYNLDTDLLDRSAYGIFLGDRLYIGEEEKLDIFLRGKYIFGGKYNYRQMDGELSGGLIFPVYSGERFQINSNKKHGGTQGFSFDAEGRWEAPWGSDIVLRGDNIFSWIVWKNVYTRSMNGEEGKHYVNNYIGHFEPFYSLKINHRLVTLGVDYWRQLYPLALVHVKQDDQRVSFGRYGPLYTAELETDGLLVSLKSDHINLPDAYNLSIELGMNFSF